MQQRILTIAVLLIAATSASVQTIRNSGSVTSGNVDATPVIMTAPANSSDGGVVASPISPANPEAANYMGATALSCGAGEQASDDLTTCVPCPRGTWKAFAGFDNCYKCGAQMSTPSTGTTAQDACVALSELNAAKLTFTLMMDIHDVAADVSGFRSMLAADVQRATGASIGRVVADGDIYAGSVIAGVSIYDTSDYGEPTSKYLLITLLNQFNSTSSLLLTGNVTQYVYSMSYFVDSYGPNSFVPVFGDSASAAAANVISGLIIAVVLFMLLSLFLLIGLLCTCHSRDKLVARQHARTTILIPPPTPAPAPVAQGKCGMAMMNDNAPVAEGYDVPVGLHHGEVAKGMPVVEYTPESKV